MAISKWISFGNTPASTSTAASPPPSAPPSEAIPATISAADQKHFGLENFGNTCYANSVLQALYFCGPFRDLIVQYPDPSTPDVPLPPPAIPTPVLPPPTSPKPKPLRRPSISDSHTLQPHPCTPSTPSIPIPPSPPTLLSALRSLYIHISRNPADRGTVAPRAFIDKLKELNELFRSTMHQDAHEFLNYLLNQIVEEIDDDRKKTGGNGNGLVNPSGEDLSTSVASLASSTLPPPSTTSVSTNQPGLNTTLVHRLFEGTLTSETRCLTCETVSSRDESFLDLSIDIEQNSSVTACLRQFSASEMLCQRNKFFCDSCCDLQEAEKRMKIKKLPNVLALHLKRFKYQEDLGKYIKLTYRVAFPLDLRLFNTVDDAENPDRLYELFAIVVHIGNGPHHGHYVSVVKARGTWYLFDDDTVEPMKESEIPKYFGESNAGSAYVLYYQAVDLDIAALGLRPPPSVPSTSQATESPAVSHSISLPSTAEQVEPDLASPSVPPGLPDPHGESNTSSPSPPTFTSPFNASPPQSTTSPQPALSLKIPIPPNVAEPAASSPVTPSGSGSGSKGLFGSLRHSPSFSRVRSGNGSSSSELRRSLVDAPPVPPIPGAAGSSSRDHDSPIADPIDRSMSPAALYGSPPIVRNSHANGKMKEKDKDKEKSGTMWFKRKSLRAERPPSSVSPNLAERSTSLQGDESSSTPWYKHSKKVMRRASEAGLTDALSVAIPSSAPDSSSMQRTSPLSPSLRPVPEHKKSTPELMTMGRMETRPSSRHRPSTAGAAVGRPSSVASPPVSLMPTSPLAVRPPETAEDAAVRQRALSSDGTSNGGHVLLAQNGGHSWPHPHGRPHTAHAPASPSTLGFSTSNGTSSTLSTNGESATTMSMSTSTTTTSTTGASSKAKKASRKLSLTAPMLGFGRKDKEKRPQSPAAQVVSRDR